MDIEQARKKFIDDWTETMLTQAGLEKPNDVVRAYVGLAVSQCMDSALLHKDILDVGCDDGYRIKI